jgi:hypothetical protein
VANSYINPTSQHSDSGFLHRYFLSNGGKRMNKWVHYFDIYERHLARFRGTAPVVLEIGVSFGGSLSMWSEYFGPGAKIIGLDIDPGCKAHDAENIEVFIGSQDDPAIAEQVLERYPQIDIVLDDGSHVMSHMIRSFEMFYPRMSPNGVYMVEDLHTCYWEEYEGGLRRRGSFIEYLKDRIDDLNASHARDAVQVSPFTRSTDSICCYDSVAVFERRPQGMRQYLEPRAM